MGVRRGVRLRWACVGALVALACAVGCKKTPPPEEEEQAQAHAPGAPRAASSEAPVDHLAPGELAPGSESAFGLTLPRVLRIERKIEGSAVFARGQAEPAAVTAFFRARVHDGKVRSLPFEGTSFEHVVATDPKIQLSIRVEPDAQGSRVEIHDVTPPPKVDLPDDEARWRAAGLKPNGQPLDPSHLQ